jgi:hypothetical protein
MLSRLHPSGCGSVSSPAVYTLVSDSSILTVVSPAEKTWIQQVVGSLLFYARALDLAALTAVGQLSSHQSNLTNTTSPLLSFFLTMSPLTATPKNPFTPLPWPSGAVSSPATCPDPHRAVSLAARSDLGTRHPTYLTNPQKAADRASRPNRPLFVLPASSHPIPLSPYAPPSPTMPPPCFLPAHTVCGRGGVRCRFWTTCL